MFSMEVFRTHKETIMPGPYQVLVKTAFGFGRQHLKFQLCKCNLETCAIL